MSEILATFVFTIVHVKGLVLIQVKKDKIKSTHKPGKHPPEDGFFRFLKEKKQTREIIIFIVLYGIVFALFRISYPYPDTYPDTGNYVLCAENMEIGGYRPIGYSWFLYFCHLISAGIHFVYYAQFTLNVIASLFLLFTVKFFFRPLKNYFFLVASILIILNPATLYLTNYLMSDSVFVSLTLVWIATAIWLIYKKSIWIFLLHLAVLFLLIQVRYSGLFFPLFSMIVLYISWGKTGKLVWIVPALVFAFVYSDTKKKTEKIFGTEVFSAFSGWQLANNAMHIVPHIDLEPGEIKNRNNSYIHSIVVTTDSSKFPDKGITSNFLWDDSLALKSVLREIRISRRMNYVKGWVYCGKVFKKYGQFLIMKYPLKYFRYFAIYNMKNIFYPPLEIFGRYVEYEPEETLSSWFNLGPEKFTPKWNFFIKYISPKLSIMNLLLWILVILILIYAVFRIRIISFSDIQRKMFWILFAFTVVYLAFHVLASPITLRYLVPLFNIKIIVPYILLNAMYKQESIS